MSVYACMYVGGGGGDERVEVVLIGGLTKADWVD